MMIEKEKKKNGIPIEPVQLLFSQKFSNRPRKSPARAIERLGSSLRRLLPVIAEGCEMARAVKCLVVFCAVSRHCVAVSTVLFIYFFFSFLSLFLCLGDRTGDNGGKY